VRVMRPWSVVVRLMETGQQILRRGREAYALDASVLLGRSPRDESSSYQVVDQSARRASGPVDRLSDLGDRGLAATSDVI
jgi:hypothetical protein